MAPAFKEWAVIVHALLEGEQMLDVRKGGLREDGRHFAVRATRVWLYPTAEHQRAELLKPAYRHWVDLAAAAPVGEPIRIDGLDSRLVWTLEYAASRLNWKKRDPLWVLAMRVHRLREPLVVPWSDGYGGCTSWVELAGLPADPAALDAEPVLSDVAFEARLKGAADALPEPFETV